MNLKSVAILCALFGLLFTGCSPDADSDLMKDENELRISASPSEIAFTAAGTTPEGTLNQVVIITLNPKEKTKIPWSATVTTGDGQNWCSMRDTVVMTGKIAEHGVVLSVTPNMEYKRLATLSVMAADKTQHFTITQLGLKADATVSVDKKELEFLAEDPPVQSVTFTTNMEQYEFMVKDINQEPVSWLHVTDKGSGVLELLADANEGEDALSRMAYLSIHVGTSLTSEATETILITQLQPDVYCYVWGSAVPDYQTAAKAPKMTKIEEGKYTMDVYLKNGTLTLSNYAKADRMPQFQLGAGNILASVATAGTAGNIPSIDIAGMRRLTVDFNTMSYQMERISTPNCMPDAEVAKYPTKSYIARDGSSKTWMVLNMRWDGGDISPKLGSKMVSSATTATGGYASDAVMPQSISDANLNPAYEEAEIGGNLQGSDTYGRIYCLSEILTGAPRNGLDSKINQTFPAGWQANDVITDAVGKSIKLGYVVNPTGFSGNNATDEETYPMLSMQVQGICPYGWHIANAQDWLDLGYAMSQASSGDTYVVNESKVTYKQLTTASGTATVGDPNSSRGLGNMAAWLRNTTHWSGNTYNHIAKGADAFGFNLYPLGFRYMKQGYQMAGLRTQCWVPLYYSDKKAYRMNVVIKDHNSTYAEMTNVDNGNAILPFRCVKNYKK